MDRSIKQISSQYPARPDQVYTKNAWEHPLCNLSCVGLHSTYSNYSTLKWLLTFDGSISMTTRKECSCSSCSNLESSFISLWKLRIFIFYPMVLWSLRLYVLNHALKASELLKREMPHALYTVEVQTLQEFAVDPSGNRSQYATSIPKKKHGCLLMDKLRPTPWNDVFGCSLRLCYVFG